MKKYFYIGPFSFHISEIRADEIDNYLDQFTHPLGFSYINIEVKISYKPIQQKCGRRVFEGDAFDVYEENGIEHRYYHQIIDGVKIFYAHNSLQGHQIEIDFYTNVITFGRRFDIWRFLFLETLLLQSHGIILHSSSVLVNHQLLLFTAPSGTGKSTQADLWKKYTDAEGINGDRNILIFQNGQWFCCGLPWHGTSTDCKNIKEPIGCISIIRQHPSDEIVPLTPASKIKYLYSEISKNSWNLQFVEEVFTLLEKLANDITILQLNCTMQESAVECLKRYLEE